MHVSGNLFDTLFHLQAPDETRVIWMDAICINQESLYERNEQVQMMGEIYAKASRVLVWLGSGDERLSEVGMETMDHFVKGRPITEAPWRKSPSNFVVAAFAGVMRREWFTRFWTVQETALAKEVVIHCGRHTMSWPNKAGPVLRFARAIKTAVVSPHWKEMSAAGVDMSHLLELLQSQSESVPDASVWSNRPPRADLLDTVYLLRDRGASEPQDRIFALLGIVDCSEEDRVVPDYSKSVEAVYDEFAAKVAWRTEVMCKELETPLSRKQRWEEIESESTQNGEQELEYADESKDLQSFLDRTCAQASADVRDKDSMVLQVC